MIFTVGKVNKFDYTLIAKENFSLALSGMKITLWNHQIYTLYKFIIEDTQESKSLYVTANTCIKPGVNMTKMIIGYQ